MPITAYHAYTSPVPDSTATSIVRPSDWNSSHLITYAADGTEIIGAFSNANGVSFGLSGTHITASVVPASGVAISAGTNVRTNGTVSFDNGGGITFAMDTNGKITAAAPAGAPSPVVVQVAGSTGTLGTINFSDANNISWGLNGSTITADFGSNQFQQTSVATYPNAGFVSAYALTSSSDATNGAYLNMPQNTLAYMGGTNIVTVSLAAQTLTLADTNANYVLGDRSNSNYVATTDIEAIDYDRYYPYAQVYRNGNRAHVQLAPVQARNQDLLEYNRTADTSRYARESGLDGINVDGSLNITVTAGKVWAMYTEYSVLAVTPATRQFFWYHVAGVWTSTSHTSPVVNNTQYDDGTNLQTLAGGYTINYLYRGIEVEDHLYTVVGTQQYDTIDQAKAAGLVANLPVEITSHAMLIGRVIVANNTTTDFTYQSAFDESFSGTTPIINHNDLAGLTVGNDHPQYFLTANSSLLQSSGAYLTTAMVSNGGSNFVGLNSALTANGVSASINSSGISLNFPAFLTTAQAPGAYLTTAMRSDAGSGFVGISTVSGTNVSGTFGSNGISLSAAAGGGGIAASIGGNSTSGGAGYSNITSGTMILKGGNNITLLQDGANITISGANVGGAQTGISGIAGSNASTATAGTVQFANGNNITFGLNGNTITASASFNQTVDINKAGTGFTTTTAAGVIWSGTNDTNGLKFAMPAYITTAALSGDTTKYAGIGYTSTTQAGSTVGVTHNTSGLSMVWPPFITTAQSPGAYLTTAAQSNQVINSLNGSTGQISLNVGSSLSASTNGSSITFGLVSNITTALQSVGAYLTTAMQSASSSNFAATGFTTTTIAGSVIAGTHDTAGLKLAVPAFLTAAAGGGAAISASGTAAGGNNSQNTGTIAFANSNGITFGLSNNGTMTASHNGLTTAAQSDHSHGNPTLSLGGGLSGATASNSNGFTLSLTQAAAAPSPINFSAGTTTSAVSGLTFSNSNGVSFGLGTGASAGVVTASVNAGGGGVAISAGTDSVFTNGTVSFGNANNFSWLTNNGSVVGSYGDPDNWALYSAAGGATAGTSASTIGTQGIYFKAGNNVTLSGSSNSIVISVQEGSWELEGNNTAGTTGSQLSAGKLYFSGGPNITLSGNSNTIVVSAAAAGGGATLSNFANLPIVGNTQTFQASGSTIWVCPFTLAQGLSIGFLRMPMSVSLANTSFSTFAATGNSTVSGQMGYTHGVEIFTQGVGANSNSLQHYTSTSGTGSWFTSIGAAAQSSQFTITVNGSFNQSGSQTNIGTGTSWGVSNASVSFASASMSQFAGMVRWIDIPFATYLSPGNYWLGIGRSVSTANNWASASSLLLNSSNVAVSQSNLTFGILGSSTNTSNILQNLGGPGFWTTNASRYTTDSINAIGQISATTSNLIPYFQFIRQA